MNDLLLKDLNSQQRDAVCSTEGPVLVFAGAGSGKTKTLTHRMAYIILNNLATAEEIVAVTFTNKAAHEMKERVNNLLISLGQYLYLPYLATFHSLAVKLLREISGDEKINLPFNSNFVIYDSADQKSILSRLHKEHSLSQQIPVQAISSEISRAKNLGMDVGAYSNQIYDDYTEKVYHIYRDYQAFLRQSNALDFDDLLLELVLVLQSNQALLNDYQDRFKYLMVDEYQDTNFCQYQITKLLTNPAKANICVVGDDWQSIYSWRGADFGNILKFESDFPGSKVVKLETNYRSTQHILDVAGSVMLSSQKRSEKKLMANSGAGQLVNLLGFNSDFDEANFVLNKISNLHFVQDVTLREIAVLYRTNTQSRLLEELFIRANLPYQIIGGVRFYERKEVKDLLSILRLLTNQLDQISFVRVSQLLVKGLGLRSIQTFNLYLQEHGISYKEAFGELDNLDLSTTIKNKLKPLNWLTEAYDLVESQNQDPENNSLADLIIKVISLSGLEDFYQYQYQAKDNVLERIENIKEVVSVARLFPDSNLHQFLAEIALLSDTDKDYQHQGVNLMTLHSAKGLEFNSVFIVGLEEGLLPHLNNIEDTEKLDEERRLLYVGMTRAKKNLYLSYSAMRNLYGRNQYNFPSRFIKDLPHSSISKQYY